MSYKCPQPDQCAKYVKVPVHSLDSHDNGPSPTEDCRTAGPTTWPRTLSSTTLPSCTAVTYTLGKGFHQNRRNQRHACSFYRFYFRTSGRSKMAFARSNRLLRAPRTGGRSGIGTAIRSWCSNTLCLACLLICDSTKALGDISVIYPGVLVKDPLSQRACFHDCFHSLKDPFLALSGQRKQCNLKHTAQSRLVSLMMQWSLLEVKRSVGVVAHSGAAICSRVSHVKQRITPLSFKMGSRNTIILCQPLPWL